MWSPNIGFFHRELTSENSLILYQQVYCCYCCLMVKSLCPTFCDPMDVACQAALSMRFPRQEYWNTGVGCHFLLQRVFLTQESNLHLLHCRWILYC